MSTALVHDYEFYKPEIDAYIKDEQDNAPKPVYEELFDVVSTDRLELNEKTISGIGPMQEVGETGDAVEESMSDGYKTSFPIKVYRQSMAFSSDLFETDQTGKIEQFARELPQSVMRSRELNTMGTLRNMANATLTYGNGKTGISIAHPKYDGSSAQPNTFSDGVQRPLNYDNALRLQDVLMKFVSGSGNLMSTGRTGQNKVIWFSPYLREVAYQIAGRKSTDKSDTSERAGNWFKEGDRFDLLELPFVSHEAALLAGETTVAVTSASNFWDTSWGIIDRDVMKKYWKMFVRKGYEKGKFSEEERLANQVTKRYANDKYAFGIIAPIGFTGSLGDNSTLAI